MTIEQIAYSPNAASKALGIRRERIAAAINAGELRCYRLGTKTRILRTDLEEWVRQSWRKS